MEKVYIPEHIGRRPSAWSGWLRYRWPFLMWVVAIALAVFFYGHGGRFGGMSGTVESHREEVAPLETARLLALYVDIGDEVHAGDVLAQMDASVLDAQMAVERLQIERRFADAAARAATDLQDARLREAETRGELEVLDDEVKRLEELREDRLVDVQTVARLKSRQQALARALELYPQTLADLEKEMAETREQEKAAKGWLNSNGEHHAEEKEGAAEIPEELPTQLGLLQLRRNTYTLRARSDGMVSRVCFEPGDIVPGGVSVLTVVAEGGGRVVGFLPEANARHLRVGMTAYLSRSSGGGPVVRARVAAMTPEILTLPNRVNPFGTAAYRGRRVILLPLEPHDFLPGESVSIELERPWLSMLLDVLLRRNVPGGAGEAEGEGT